MGDFVDAIHQNFVVWHTKERSYDGLQERLHKFVESGRHHAGRGTSSKCRWAGFKYVEVMIEISLFTALGKFRW